MRVIRHNLNPTGYDPAAALHLGTVTLSYRSATKDGCDTTGTVHFRCALPLPEMTTQEDLRKAMLEDAMSNLTLLWSMKPGHSATREMPANPMQPSETVAEG